jgi:hypothetical protein
MIVCREACNLPLPYTYSKYLYYSSFLIGLSSFVSFYYQDYKTFLFMFILFMSSIRFWRRPDYGWVRDLDMFLCKCIGVYFYMNTLCYYDEYCRAVSMHVLLCVLLFYAIELILYSLQCKKWIIFHMALHFYVSFFTPFILYML